MSAQTVKIGVVQQAISGNDKSQNWADSAKQIRALANDGAQCIYLRTPQHLVFLSN